MYACNHCLGGPLDRPCGCIHCREARAARLDQGPRGSRLSDAERAALEIFPRESQTFAGRLRQMMIPVKPAHRAPAQPAPRALGNSVLPDSFQLAQA